ncbi:unnamed protein product [Ranitomeya imitator]|uniref:Uncharacterized protein n=1 Tax=Ranitomeya imitator TaxID=111125 RepID=A0ABN9LNV0_9NEOB|nr:unnamed protein product [Ranitomeya imitator]
MNVAVILLLLIIPASGDKSDDLNENPRRAKDDENSGDSEAENEGSGEQAWEVILFGQVMLAVFTLLK